MDSANNTMAPTDSMRAAGRALLRVQRAALTAAEAAVRAGDDAKAVRHMRVADRRMRVALRLLEPYVPERPIRRMLRDLGTLHEALGAVRDLEVLIDQARHYRAALPPAGRADLDGLLAEWRGERKRARKLLRRALDSPDLDQFRTRLDAFLDADDEAPNQEAGATPYQVRHVAGSALWRRYEAVRVHEAVLGDPSNPQLHRLRIAGKYLRYTLEFFRGVLPADAAALIGDLVALQDQLGELHDAEVTAGLIRKYWDGQARRRRPRVQQMPSGLAAYLADREAALAARQSGAAPLRAAVCSPAWRLRLAAVVAAV